ncbi:hypothetical protein HHX47_DHR3000412, partial [Lentinula edodes]
MLCYLDLSLDFNKVILFPSLFVVSSLSASCTSSEYHRGILALTTTFLLVFHTTVSMSSQTTNSSTAAIQSRAISKKSVNIRFIDPTTGKRLPVSKSTIEPPVVRTWLRTAFAENYDFFDQTWKTVFENGFNGSAVWRQDSNGVFTIKFKRIGNVDERCLKKWCTMNVDR